MKCKNWCKNIIILKKTIRYDRLLCRFLLVWLNREAECTAQPVMQMPQVELDGGCLMVNNKGKTG